MNQPRGTVLSFVLGSSIQHAKAEMEEAAFNRMTDLAYQNGNEILTVVRGYEQLMGVRRGTTLYLLNDWKRGRPTHDTAQLLAMMQSSRLTVVLGLPTRLDMRSMVTDDTISE